MIARIDDDGNFRDIGCSRMLPVNVNGVWPRSAAEKEDWGTCVREKKEVESLNLHV